MNFRRFIPCAIALLISTFVSSSDATLIVHGARHYIADSPGGGNGALDYYGYTCERYVTDDAAGSGDGLAIETAWTYSQAIASGASLVVCFEPGTYVGTDTNDRFVGTFNPPAGSVGDPTIFVVRRAAAYNATDRSEFSNGVTTGDNGSATVSVSSDHSYWIGPYVNEDVSRSTSDTGPLVIFDCDDCGIEGARVDGITVTRVGDDNHNAIRIEAATNFFARNNYLTGTKEDSNSQNSAAIMVYSSRTGDIDHNFVGDCNNGIYVKGESAGNGELGDIRVRWNHVDGIASRSGIQWGGANTDLSLASNEVYGNLVTNSDGGIYFQVFGNAEDPDGASEIDVHHNTFANIAANGGGAVGTQDAAQHVEAMDSTTWRDNVIVGDGTGIGFALGWSAANNATIAARGFASNYNALYNFSVWGYLDSNQTTRANFNSASGYDADSITLTGDPFTNAAGGDYTLNNTAGAGAAARTGSSTGGYMGYEGSGGTPGLQ